MRFRIILYTLLLFTVLGGGALRAQTHAFTVSWDSGMVPFPRIVGYGDTVRYTLSITNNTSTIFLDTLRFNLRTSLGSFLIADLGGQAIAPQATETFTFLDSCQSFKYSGGVNVVVVWPTSPSFMDTDSLIDTLIVNDPLGIPRPEQHQFSIFPIPVEDILHLTVQNQGLRVRETRLVDYSGRVILRFDGMPGTVDMRALPAGTYLILVEEEKGRLDTRKVVKY